MLEDRGIRVGVEVLVGDAAEPDKPARRGVVIRTYPKPSRWMVVKFDTGDIEQVEESQVTTMFEYLRKTSLI